MSASALLIIIIIIIWLLHNLVEANFDLFRYLLLGDQLTPWELHPLVSYAKIGAQASAAKAQELLAQKMFCPRLLILRISGFRV